MLRHASHAGGLGIEDEIEFRTPFDYMFPDRARSPECLLPVHQRTGAALEDLGAAMADPGVSQTALDSEIPAVFTYLGQFIDHDLTANTDREEAFTIAGPRGEWKEIHPADPDHVVGALVNGRRPHFDLDSVYGDGPGLAGAHKGGSPKARTEAQELFDSQFRLRVQHQHGVLDLPRREEGKAVIADMRNDENLIISQLHTGFLKFHNAVLDATAAVNGIVAYVRARQLSRWAYQYVVVNDYLQAVCDRHVVLDILHNGPRFYAPSLANAAVFMPLEFSVAAFRFGHSMIRPAYKINDTTTDIEVMKLLEPAGAANLVDKGRLKKPFVVHWKNFVGGDAQRARRIDARLSKGLFALPFGQQVLAHLAKRNLLRGYLLSIPTGQAIAHAMRIEPLTADELCRDESKEVQDALRDGDFLERTPLWFYILKEADIHNDGQALGAVGSRIVAETILGLIKTSPNSYLNAHDEAVTSQGIVIGGTTIDTMESFLRFAGMPIDRGH